MATDHISKLKQAYQATLTNKERSDRALEIASQPLYSPLLKPVELHAEEEPNLIDINSMMKEIGFDVTILNAELGNSANMLKTLITNTDTRLKAVKNILESERERQQDINMLCNKYTEFGKVTSLSPNDFTGQYGTEDGVFFAMVSGKNNASYSIQSVEGNGYEGNKYVYKDNAFLEDSINTSSRNFINDGSSITAYEYSRITASNTEPEIFPLVNFDSVDAKCTIAIASSDYISAVKIASDNKIIVTEVAVSSDGAEYKTVLDISIEINDSSLKYNTSDYICGSGIISFPLTKYVKLTIMSSGTTEDQIAFTKIIITSADDDESESDGDSK
jgi:hypothetical protein